ncbi:MAG: extracellular solute-binding protein [Eubacteriales bacterium]|jgi:ABC-type glycerol-3-phosphate transport system substrate-binding protein
MKKALCRILALTLSVLCIAALFTGCGKKAPAPVKVQYVYKSEDIALPAGIREVNQVIHAGDYLYLNGADHDENYSYYQQKLVRMKLDGSDVSELPVFPQNDNEAELDGKTIADGDAAAVEAVPDDAFGENVNGGEYTYVQGMCGASDGTLWYIESRSIYDYSDPENYKEENHFTLRHVDGANNPLAEINLDALNTDPEGWFYITQFAIDDAGNIYLTLNDRIAVLDPTGKKLFEIELDIENGENVSGMIRSGEGKIICSFYGKSGGNNTVREIDVASGGFGREGKITNTEGASTYAYYNILPGFGCTLFYSDQTAVYSYDIATQVSTPVLNFINSDIDANQNSNIVPISATQMITIGYSYDDYSPVLMRLTKVPDEDVVAKRIITLGTTGLNYMTRRAVVAFNKSNEEYRIEVRDYSSYNGTIVATAAMSSGSEIEYDWEAGMKKFNNELIAGNIPDIIQIDSNMPYASYVSKGLLADLYPFFEKDEEFNKSDFLENIFTSLETNGKLYSFTPGFNLYTVLGKSSLVGNTGSWTMDQMLALQSAHPDAKLFSETTRDNFMQYAITLSADSYIDYQKGACSFNTPSFQRLLEIAKTFPEEINYEELWGEENWEEYWNESQTQYRDNKTLLMVSYLYDFSYLHTIEAAQFGEPVTLIGFPCDNGSGSAFILSQQYAISAKSANSAGAWQFLRSFLTDEYQNKLSENSGEFPIKLSALSAYAQKAMTPHTYVDENGNTVEQPNTYWMVDQEIDIGYPTQADIDRMMDFIRSIKTVFRTDSSLMDIINEETGAFFAGQKTAQEVSDIIQNRIQIYISESR